MVMSKNINLTPSAVNKHIKRLLEDEKHFINFDIIGEISNLKSSGSMSYFLIKDKEAEINCVLFSNYASKIHCELKDGMKVILTGSIYYNVKKGSYSINVKNAVEAGVGDLAREFELLKKKLESLGMFNQKNKQSIKSYNQKIALITAPTSAAVKDMITTIKRRNPIADIIIVPAIVQGARAAKSIVDAIELVNKRQLADVMIIGRGGGSIEDLWAFNEEPVAIATYNSKIPIVSSVGHETDTTIIDYVADLRAPTPTAAAEFVTIDINEKQKDIQKMIEQNKRVLINDVNMKNIKMENIKNNQYFQNPFFNYRLNLDNLNEQIKFVSLNMSTLIRYKKEKNNQFNELLIKELKNSLLKKESNLKAKHIQLDDLNPLSILSRGYSYVTKDDKMINDSKSVEINSEIQIVLNKGNITAKVVKKGE